jgi:outer membrane protein
MRLRVHGWAAGIGLGLLASGPLAAQAPAAGVRIAVVDVPLVLQGYKKREVLLKEMEGRVKGVELQVEALRARIKELEEKIASDLAQKDPATREQLEIELAKTRPDLDVELRRRALVINRETAKAMRELFDDIKAGVDEVARREGVDLVFQVVPPSKPDVNVQDEIVRRPVLYYKKDTVLDLTDRVVRQVNETYEKAGK